VRKKSEVEWERRTQQRISHDSSMVGEDGWRGNGMGFSLILDTKLS